LIKAKEDEIVGVVTQPDKPKGRGQKITPPPVKVLAQKHNIPVYQPYTVKDEGFIELVKDILPDLFVVVAFGQIIPKSLLSIPPYGAVNVHPSLLPKYRGAAPIQWAIINGETVTGVSIVCITPYLDSGDILLQKAVPIEPEQTAGELHDILAKLGAELLLKAIRGIKKGNLTPIPQNGALATYAPKIKKEDGLIDWNIPAKKIACLIRGLDPTPGAYSYLNGKLLKLFRPLVIPFTSKDEIPGTIIEANPKGIHISTKEGILVVKEVQLEGRKRMPVSEFIKGHSRLKGKKLKGK